MTDKQPQQLYEIGMGRNFVLNMTDHGRALSHDC